MNKNINKYDNTDLTTLQSQNMILNNTVTELRTKVKELSKENKSLKERILKLIDQLV